MRKIVVVLVVIGLVSVLGLSSVESHLWSVMRLTEQWTEIGSGAIGGSLLQRFSAAEAMFEIINEVEIEILAAIQEAQFVIEAQIILALTYALAGMRLGTEGLQKVDIAKITAGTELIVLANTRLMELKGTL